MARKLPTTLSLALAAALLAGCGQRAILAGASTSAYMPGHGDMAKSRVAGTAESLAESVSGTAGLAGPNAQAASGLKGGEIDDNTEFGRFLAYLDSYKASNVLRVDVSGRHVLRVVDAAGKAVPNATVKVSRDGAELASLRSASDGRVLFFPAQASGDFAISVRKGDLALDATLASRSATLALPGPRGTLPAKLDIAFVLDVTGSMGDELERIQQTIGDITARIKSLPAAPQIRYGLVAFRDRTDDYVTRTEDFTQDLAAFKAKLGSLAAAGGGDYPEAVQEALHDAVSNLSWDTGDALRLMFVVGDAPPHLDYLQDHAYTSEMRKAAGAGIKIFPIAASGLDNQGEYVFRQLAQYTGGKFLYITYGGDTPHHVGPVQENDLDDLVVGIVKTELANLE